MASSSGTILFDGVCNLCNGFVQFVIRRDAAAYFRFAALQSEEGQKLLKDHGLPTQKFSTILLLENGQLYTQSTAALRIFRKLGLGWKLLSLLRVVPAFLRNPLYNFVSRNRYRWFGQRESCMLPTPELKTRFL